MTRAALAARLEPGTLVEVGLFPLPNVVLFPGMRVPLRVFEPRYRKLVSDILDADRLVAIPRLKPGYQADYYGNPDVFPICGLGQIARDVRLPDGRYEIEVVGVARVELLTELEQSPYRRARGRVLADAAGGQTASALYTELAKLLAQLRPYWSEAGRRLEQSALEGKALGACTDALAPLLESADERQQLLAELDPTARALLLFARLHELCETVQEHENDAPSPNSRPN